MSTFGPTLLLSQRGPAEDVARLPGISCAFQPIVDARSRTVISYEALVRGASGESAHDVLGKVPRALLARFDEHCRGVALQQAARLGIACDLHLNLMPGAVQSATDCLATTQRIAQAQRISLEALVIEVTEQELLGDEMRFLQLCELYRGHGMRVAFDDFGSGFSGLTLLAEFQPDELKLDKALVRGIARDGPRQAIVRAVLQMCRDLGIEFIAEGIETREEYLWFCGEGVHLFQGYLFARPGFESLPEPVFPV